MTKEFEEILETLKKKCSKSEANRLGALKLAWIGDSIFSDYVRKYLVLSENRKIGKLNNLSVDYVKAKAQSDIIHYLRDNLTSEEREIVKKGRNTLSQVPKNASVNEYRYATGFEALIGWHQLTGNKERVLELCSKGIEYIKNCHLSE